MLSIFLFLPLLFLRETADLRDRPGRVHSPRYLDRGALARFTLKLAQRFLLGRGRLLAPVTASTAHVLRTSANRAKAAVAPLERRGRARVRLTARVLAGSPRVHPQTT